MRGKMDKMAEIAKKIITEELEKKEFKVLKTLLFGSRKRGDYRKNGDWDFLVILNNDVDFKKKQEINLKIKRRLAGREIPNDIFINPENYVERYRKDLGGIPYYASKEGKEI